MPVPPPSEVSTPWLDSLSRNDRRLVLFLLSHPPLEPALRSPWIVDVRLQGSSEPSGPLFSDSVTLDIGGGDLREAHRVLLRLDDGQQCLLLRNVVQRLPDYRSVIAAAFEKLATGGFLIIIVPHQFLYERKLQVPSRHDPAVLRFYTPGALLAEVEEALDPCRYRVRVLADHDADFDYRAELARVPEGGHDIVLCLQKIATPPWREAMEQAESQSAVDTRPNRFLEPYDGTARVCRVVAPDDSAIRRIIVLKLDHRGDFTMATPAFQILREAFSDAEITLVCGTWNRQEAQRLTLFDRVVPFDFFAEDASAGLSGAPPEDLQQRFAGLIAEEHYDLAIDLRLYEDTRKLLSAIDARHKAGFDPYDEFPWLTIPLGLPIPTHSGRAETAFIAASAFDSRRGEHRDFALVFRDREEPADGGMLLWGPYVTLPPGHYQFDVLVEPREDTFELGYDLAGNHGRDILGVGLLRVERERFPQVSLHLTEPIEGFELRLLAASAGAPPFRFFGLRYTRRGAFIGVHQRELMALLAHLVALRLQFPYTVALL